MFWSRHAAPAVPNDAAALPEPPFRLLGVAILWLLLALVTTLVADIAVGLMFDGSFSSVATSISFYGVLLWAAIVRGRIVGGGDLRAGFGDGPVLKRPLIGLLAVIAVAGVVLFVAAHYYG